MQLLTGNIVIMERRRKRKKAYKRERALPEVIQAVGNAVELKFMSDLFRCSAVYTHSLLASKRCLPMKHLVALRTRLCCVFYDIINPRCACAQRGL